MFISDEKKKGTLNGRQGCSLARVGEKKKKKKTPPPPHKGGKRTTIAPTIKGDGLKISHIKGGKKEKFSERGGIVCPTTDQGKPSKEKSGKEKKASVLPAIWAQNRAKGDIVVYFWGGGEIALEEWRR